jgi:S1-C subfamily serine protease
MSFPVVLRLTPDYGAEVDGMRIAGVNPSGPAAKGGLREGDVIVRLGETPVHSVDDYMVALGKGRPGKALAVEVRRGQERVVLEVIPESTRAR